MRIVVLVVAVLALNGCGSSWTAERKASFILNCSEAAQADDVSFVSARSMCECLARVVSENYGYEDFAVNEVTYTKELKRQGKLAQCTK